ncbi:MAG: ABC transporter ATP-binding protein [Halanaerobiaceae bacterium]|nr:ABC transporter ATP-binding protein [Halanaerobiaceae bacterium]
MKRSKGKYEDNGKDKKILAIKNISKNFTRSTGEFEVLKNISLDIYEEEIVALVGPSGCGKTTLLNIVSNILTADSGEIVMDSDKVLAYIFQEPRLLPWLTVDQNIRFVQDNFPALEKADEIREKLLIRSGLLEFRDSYPGQLSGGMKQRLEIIRALSIRPDLVLMDEPFKSLDISLKYQLQEMILTEKEEYGFAVLFITHDPEEAVLLADRVITLTDKPAGINKTIRIALPREERSLKDEEIYSKYEEILGFILSSPL